MLRSWILLLFVVSWTSTACSTEPSTAGGGADTADASTSGDAADAADAGDAAEPGDSGDPGDSAGPDASADADASADSTDAADTSRDWKQAFDLVLPGDHVIDLRLTFAAGDWSKLLTAWQQTQQKIQLPAAFAHDDETLPSIGVRLKGLNGLNIPPGTINLGGKYPLKLDFNAMGGERFHGVDKISLNTNLQDPSMMRERLSLRMYLAMGIPSSRAAYAKVEIDGTHVGLYNAVQVIDKRYLKERFGTADGADDGNLYKCVYNSDGICSMTWRGDKKSDYYTTSCPDGFDECGFVLKTNEDDPKLNDFKDLIAFLDVLAHASDESFPAAIDKVFDVDSFLRVAAVAFAISNHDSYFGKGHNYYLYRHPATGKFQYLPWDLDLTYGSTSCEADIGDPTCGQADTHPLVKRVFSVPAWRKAYLGYLKEVANTHLVVAKHQAWIDELDALIGPLVAADPNGPGATAYAAERDGLLAFVTARRADILKRLADAGE